MCQWMQNKNICDYNFELLRKPVYHACHAQLINECRFSSHDSWLNRHVFLHDQTRLETVWECWEYHACLSWKLVFHGDYSRLPNLIAIIGHALLILRWISIVLFNSNSIMQSWKFYTLHAYEMKIVTTITLLNAKSYNFYRNKTLTY